MSKMDIDKKMGKMDLDHQEFPASIETRGVLYPGRLVFGYQGLGFKNIKTGKTFQVAPADWEKVTWIRIAGGFGLKLFLRTGQMYRFAGFREGDFETVSKLIKKNYQLELAEENKSVRGWNWGSVKFNGSVMELAIEKQTGFALPLSYVSQCTTAKNEAILEFHPSDEAAVSLMEMRFYIPQEGAEGDPLESFHQNVISKADIIQATGDALLSLNEVPSLTPRGRYELKIYPTFLQLHGKTFDYKIPYNSVLRIFILPHSDGRQMFFVLSLDPPIKQGQTRYPFLILNFKKDEDPIEVDLELTDEELKDKYDGRLEKHLSGQTYEVLGRVLKGLVNRKITVPGAFKGITGSSALTCSYKAAAGFLYPLDRGFIYVHKPAIHLRFDEVSSVNFARSGGNTRSFDFEVETKNQILHTFSGIPKEEYQRLFDFVSSKGLRVKNRGDREEAPRKNFEEFLDSDDDAEHDPYMEQVKKEGKERDQDEDEEDEDFKPPSETSDVAEEFDSDAKSSSDEDEDEDASTSKKKPKEKKVEKKRRNDDDESSKPKKARKEKGSKKSKDPDLPKRPMTAYFLYMNEMRDRIKKENPGIALPDIGKKAAEMWKAESDKSRWEKKAEDAKEKYQEEMKEYQKKQVDKDDAGDREKSSKPSKSSKSEGKKKSSSTASKVSPVKVKSKEYISSGDDSSSSEEDTKKSKAKKSDLDDSD